MGAANVELELIWATRLAKALEGKDVKELLSNVGAGGAGPADSSGGPGGEANLEELGTVSCEAEVGGGGLPSERGEGGVGDRRAACLVFPLHHV